MMAFFWCVFGFVLADVVIMVMVALAVAICRLLFLMIA